jgi:hypothetical protein
MEELTKESQEKLNEIKKMLDKSLNLDEVENLIKNNEIEFEYAEVRYKVKKPSFSQKQIIYKKRIEFYTKFLKDENYLLEKDLKAEYLKRNIDIDAMQTKIYNLQLQKESLYLKLGENIKNNASDPELQLLKNEIQKINSDIQIITIEKTNLLEMSIETQVLIQSYSYLTFLVTEKYIKGKDLGDGNKEPDPGWVKVWNNYEDFLASDEILINKSSFYTSLLVGREL